MRAEAAHLRARLQTARLVARQSREAKASSAQSGRSPGGSGTASADLLTERIARLVQQARDAGWPDETIAAELQDAADALHEGLS